MGTRNLIVVIKDGKEVIAQYGQWDGYWSGQGFGVCEFVKEKENVVKLKEALKKVRFLDVEGTDKEFVESYDKNAPEWSNEPDNRTPEQISWFKNFMSRDLGSKILQKIIDSDEKEIILNNEIEFVKDSLLCEFAYVIDLDNEVVEFYKGFNKSPVDEKERFSGKKNDGGYYPVRLFEKIKFSDITSETVKYLEEKDSNEEDDE